MLRFSSQALCALAFSSLFVVATYSVAWAEYPSGPEINCGANDSQYVETVASDGHHTYSTYRGLRAITLKGVKKKTNIQRVIVYGTQRWQRRQREQAFDMTNQFYAYCEGVPGRLCAGQSATACVPRRLDVSRIEISTEGSNHGRVEVRLGYRNR